MNSTLHSLNVGKSTFQLLERSCADFSIDVKYVGKSPQIVEKRLKETRVSNWILLAARKYMENPRSYSRATRKDVENRN